jgi:hypothetical protein
VVSGQRSVGSWQLAVGSFLFSVFCSEALFVRRALPAKINRGKSHLIVHGAYFTIS